MNTKRKFMKTMIGLTLVGAAGLLTSCGGPGYSGETTTNLRTNPSTNWWVQNNGTNCFKFNSMIIPMLERQRNRTAPASGNLPSFNYTTGNGNWRNWNRGVGGGIAVFARIDTVPQSMFQTNIAQVEVALKAIGYYSAESGSRSPMVLPRVGDIVTTRTGGAGHFVTIINTDTAKMVNNTVTNVTFYDSLSGTIMFGNLPLDLYKSGNTGFARPNSGFVMQNITAVR